MDKAAHASIPGQGNDRFRAVIEPLLPGFGQLQDFLEAQVDAFEPEVRPLVEYCFGHSGKKLRPVLVFSMALGSDDPFSPQIIKAAAIVELVHLATLVHDDILDGADLRHRTETVVSKFGSHVAVLLGDALFSHALHLAAEFPDVEICRRVSLATRQVCSGEIAQTFARGEGVPSPEAYYRMIDLKTAELFTVSAHLGGYLSGFEPQALDAARRFARHLGIAYQIYDDAADIFAEEAIAGKTLGTDLATGKYTLPLLLWFDSMDPARREEVLGSINSGNNGHAQLRSALLEAEIPDRVGEAFSRELAVSRSAIDSIPGSACRQQLGKLVDFLQLAWNKFSIR
jgi:octaprenyl-diphosphate synthase